MSAEQPTIWERLKLEPTSDQRAVKRAYAKQLKLIDVAKDPAGFQDLREARDYALYYVDYDDEEEWYSEDTTDATKSEEEGEQTAQKSPIPTSSDNQDDQDITLHIDLRTEAEPATPAPIPVNIITIDDDNLDEGDTPSQDNTSDELSYDDIYEEIELLVGPWGRWERQSWKSLIEKVRESAFEKFHYTESQILFALSKIMDDQIPLTNEKRTAQRDILIYLDEEFGWSQNDRRVYDILSDDQSLRLMDYLRNNLTELDQSNQSSYYDASGFPSLTEDNFKNYLGKSGTSYEKYYQRCLNEGRRFPAEWCWPGFIFAPLWLAHRCNDSIESLVGSIYLIGVICLGLGLSGESSVYTNIGAIALLAVHYIVGMYGKRILINTMATTLTELDEDDKLTEDEKLNKLKQTGHGGIKAIWDLVSGMVSIAIIGLILYFMYEGFTK